MSKRPRPRSRPVRRPPDFSNPDRDTSTPPQRRKPAASEPADHGAPPAAPKTTPGVSQEAVEDHVGAPPGHASARRLLHAEEILFSLVVEGRLIRRTQGMDTWTLVPRDGRSIPVHPVVGHHVHRGVLAEWHLDDAGNAVFIRPVRDDLADPQARTSKKRRQGAPAASKASRKNPRKVRGKPFEATLTRTRNGWCLELPTGSTLTVQVSRADGDRWEGRTTYWSLHEGHAAPVRTANTRSGGLPGLGKRR